VPPRRKRRRRGRIAPTSTVRSPSRLTNRSATSTTSRSPDEKEAEEEVRLIVGPLGDKDLVDLELED